MKSSLALLLSAASSIKLSGEDVIVTPKMTDAGYIEMNYPGQRTFEEIRRDDNQRDYEEDFEIENPNLAKEVADKVINHQKTLR